MIITFFAIIGACVVSASILILLIFLSRLLIAVLADVLKLLITRKPFQQFFHSHKDTANNGWDYRYKFNPSQYFIYSIHFLNSPLRLFCNWLQKIKLINDECADENKSSGKEDAGSIPPEVPSQPAHGKVNLSRGKKGVKKNNKEGEICPL